MVVIEAYFHGMPFGIPTFDILMMAHSTAMIQIKDKLILSCGHLAYWIRHLTLDLRIAE